VKNPLQGFKGLSRGRKAGVVSLAVTTVAILTGAGACDDTPSAQNQAQNITNAYSQAAQDAVPYPLDDMKKGGWTERRLLAEHLKRQNDPKGLRYIIVMTQQGQVIAQYPVQGMVFHPDSAMTNADSISWSSNGGSGVVEAPGDNGTWGPEAGAAAFFTTSGVEIQLPASAVWIESDAPLGITDKPLVTYNAGDKPSTNYGGVPVGGR
jgi:hypothetical protein